MFCPAQDTCHRWDMERACAVFFSGVTSGRENLFFNQNERRFKKKIPLYDKKLKAPEARFRYLTT
jgi:hypothetical protein